MAVQTEDVFAIPFFFPVNAEMIQPHHELTYLTFSVQFYIEYITFPTQYLRNCIITYKVYKHGPKCFVPITSEGILMCPLWGTERTGPSDPYFGCKWYKYQPGYQLS
jgi:hypothetical protein